MVRRQIGSSRVFLVVGALIVAILGWSVALAAPAAPTVAAPAPGIALSPAGPGSWSSSIVPSPVLSIFAVGSDVYVGQARGGLLKSNDRGLHFSSTTAPNAKALWARTEGEVYAAYANQISRSTDHGEAWQTTSLTAGVNVAALWGAGTQEVYAVGANAAARPGPHIAYSSDSGKTFAVRKLGPQVGFLLSVGGSGPKEVIVGGADIYAKKALLFRSTDQGKHWAKLPIPKSKTTYATSSINGICFTNSGKLFVATGESVFTTTDKGAHWKFAVSANAAELLSLVCNGKEVFVATRGHSLLHSKDDGATWSSNELEGQLPEAPYGAMQAVSVGATGDVYVGGEGTYQPITGALYRRAAK